LVDELYKIQRKLLTVNLLNLTNAERTMIVSNILLFDLSVELSFSMLTFQNESMRQSNVWSYFNMHTN
jgi:hypothetical protein